MKKDETDKKTEEDLHEERAVIRLKAMIKAFESGSFTLPNRDPNKPRPEVNYDDIPDDVTVYASMPLED